MPDREKLIELLKQLDRGCPKEVSCHNCEYQSFGGGCSVYARADHLIANGVTIQQWIPVTERLPDAGKVLCLTTKGHYKVMEWLETFKCWTDPGGIDFTNFKRGYVTHWMPLPSTEGLK